MWAATLLINALSLATWALHTGEETAATETIPRRLGKPTDPTISTGKHQGFSCIISGALSTVGSWWLLQEGEGWGSLGTTSQTRCSEDYPRSSGANPLL